MTVADRIAFGLLVRPRATKPSRREIKSRVEELLRLVQIEGLGKRYPAPISGGQRQRMARARMHLLYEPFGALDAKGVNAFADYRYTERESTDLTEEYESNDIRIGARFRSKAELKLASIVKGCGAASICRSSV